MVILMEGQTTCLVSSISSQQELGCISMKLSIKMPLICSQRILQQLLAWQMRQEIICSLVPSQIMRMGLHRLGEHLGPVEEQIRRYPVIMFMLEFVLMAYISSSLTMLTLCWHSTAISSMVAVVFAFRMISGLKRSMAQQLENLSKVMTQVSVMVLFENSMINCLQKVPQLSIILAWVKEALTIFTFEQEEDRQDWQLVTQSAGTLFPPSGNLVGLIQKLTLKTSRPTTSTPFGVSC